MLAGGNLYSQGYAESVVQSAIADAVSQVAASTSLDKDPSSRLVNVELNSIQIGVNSVAAGMTVLTAAGDEAPIYVPFPRYDMDINA